MMESTKAPVTVLAPTRVTRWIFLDMITFDRKESEEKIPNEDEEKQVFNCSICPIDSIPSHTEHEENDGGHKETNTKPHLIHQV